MEKPNISVDIIIKFNNGIILVRRKNPPFGWALPGGFVDYGETLETAAAREAKEETNLELKDLKQFHAYSDPERDPRHHTITVVFTATGTGNLIAGDDAGDAKWFSPDNLPELVFDHAKIIEDFRTGIQ